MDTDNTLTFFIGGPILLLFVGFMAMVIIVGGTNTANSLGGRYEVSGEVTALPTGKMHLTSSKHGTSGSEKFAVTLDHTKIVNCTSTQCSALTIGEHVVLSCYKEWNLAQPDEEECRFDHLVAAE